MLKMQNQPRKKLLNRFKVELDYKKGLTFTQRVKILFGHNIKLRINLLVDKRDGRVWESVEMTTTPEKAPVTPVTQIAREKAARDSTKLKSK